MTAIRSLSIDAYNDIELSVQLRQAISASPASLAICFGTIDSIALIAKAKECSALSTHWLAGSSCQGTASDHGLAIDATYAATLLLIDDTKGHYGVAGAEIGKNSREQAAAILQQAMMNAGKPFEQPALIWCMQAPGNEESILAGIQDVVGQHVPVFGGSSADNDVSGKWCQFDGNTLYQQGLVIAVMYPYSPISSYFSSGYAVSECQGIATATAGRQLLSIDNQPAADIYNQWLAKLKQPLLQPGNVLMASTFNPLGRVLNPLEEIPISLMSHPAYLNDDGSLNLFSEIAVGDNIFLMHGDKKQLIARAAEVVNVAKSTLRIQYNREVAGAIIVYCAGCMLSVKDDLADVQAGLKAALPDIPFVVTFTFGEQGCFVDGSSRHGNLMISAVLFGADNA